MNKSSGALHYGAVRGIMGLQRPEMLHKNWRNVKTAQFQL